MNRDQIQMTPMLVALKYFKVPIITKLSSEKHWIQKCGPKASSLRITLLEIQIILLKLNH